MPNSSQPTHQPSPDHLAANYDEALVGNLPIPDVLTCTDGTQISTAQQWRQKRRPELLELFAREMFGRTLAQRQLLAAEEHSEMTILGGLGRMRETTLRYGQAADQVTRLLCILPAAAKGAVPIFVALNFGGNQEVMESSAICIPEGWFRSDPQNGYVNNRATAASRGVNARRWPLETILQRGYGIATAYYGDFDPDFDDGFNNGVHPLSLSNGTHPLGFSNNEKRIIDDAWGAIGAWAWGLSLLADHLITLPQVDASRLIALGHSRLGKAALWAGAQDERFAIVISNNSGCGGAALSRRNFGESIERINRVFPHWFCRNFHKYGRKETSPLPPPSECSPAKPAACSSAQSDAPRSTQSNTACSNAQSNTASQANTTAAVAALPFDQHALIALIAPRPVYVASATEDLWADPRGEFLAAHLASPVYALFGKEGLLADQPPPPDTSIGEAIGYHSRSGKHDILRFDWERYMDFADKHLHPAPVPQPLLKNTKFHS